MPETTSRLPKRSVTIVAIVLAILATDTAAWAFACLRLQQGVAEGAAQTGRTVQTTSTRWRGWPLAAELLLADATIRSTPDTIPAFVWTVPVLTIRVSALAPQTLAIAAAGRQTLTLGNAPSIAFEAAAMLDTIDLAQRTPPRLTATALAIDAPDFTLDIAAATLDLSASGWSATLTGLTLPLQAAHSLHPAIDTIRLTGRVTPPFEPMQTAHQSAQAWRTQNGHLDVELQSLKWGALDATARATLTLDDALQPRGDGSLTATGLAATLSQLADNAVITSAAAGAANALLAILSAPAAGRPLTLPMTWQSNTFSIARFPLLRTIPLRWD